MLYKESSVVVESYLPLITDLLNLVSEMYVIIDMNSHSLSSVDYSLAVKNQHGILDSYIKEHTNDDEEFKAVQALCYSLFEFICLSEEVETDGKVVL